jgi:aspergillopepsin I
VARVYDPKGSGGKKLEGHSWQIRYGDMSGASGQVYLDKVTIGDLTVPEQAVEAATTVSRTFSRDNANDGLIGLAFSKLNTVKPKSQMTWFDNIKPKLAAPVFTAALKRRQVGTYDFGYIDRSKYQGEIVWTNVKGAKGFWDFAPSAFIVGNAGGEARPATINAIADTGTSLWYLPKAVADAYWAQVPGASYNNLQAGFTFPCNSKLPDMTMVIQDKKVTVPGINMNYQQISSTTCYGGIQRDSGMPFSIFGDVFLKGLFVVFESPSNGPQRLGFALQRGQ